MIRARIVINCIGAMKAIVFNNTSRFHMGCGAVMRCLHSEINAAGIEILESVYGNTLWHSSTFPVFSHDAWSSADLIIVNGEGTMHDDSRMAVFLLEDILAQRGGKKAALVNSLWQNMSSRYTKLLTSLDLVVFRDYLSQQSAGISGSVVMPDLSYYEVPPWSYLDNQGFIKGTFYIDAFSGINLDGFMNIASEDWSIIVNKLRHARACFTGKHHEVYAACIARCPFISTKIATHKIAALGEFIGEELHTVAPDAGCDSIQSALHNAAEDAHGLYRRLFDSLETLSTNFRLRDYLRSLL